MEPRENPTIQEPKEREKSGQVVKGARSMLAQEYKKQARDKTQRVRDGAEYASEKLEGAAVVGGNTAKRAAGWGVRAVQGKVINRWADQKERQADSTVEGGTQATEGGQDGRQEEGRRKVQDKRRDTGRDTGRGATREYDAGYSAHDTDNFGTPSAEAAARQKAAARARDRRRQQTTSDVPKEQAKKTAYPADHRKQGYAQRQREAEAQSRKNIRHTEGHTTPRQQTATRNTIRQRCKEDRPRQKSVSAKTKSVGAANKTRKKAQKKASQEAQKQAKQKAVQAAKATARTARRFAIIIAKSAAAVVKGMLAVLGPLGIVAVVFLVIAAVAGIFGSPFGLFYNSELDDSMTISEAMGIISSEYSKEIQRIQDDNPHDTLELGDINITNWRDILAVYAVTTTTAKDGMDVLTMDDERLDLLRAVLWDMVEITYSLETTELEETVTTTDDEGEEVTATVTVQETILHISVSLKTYMDMMEEYSFDRDQWALLEEMMSPEYDEQFAALIGIIGDSSGAGVISKGIYIWPSPVTKTITSYFGPRSSPGGIGSTNHQGIDIGAWYGMQILAAASGTVTLAGWNGGYGYCVMIDHGDGNSTLYAHCSSLLVSAGQTVTLGQVIALVGSTGNSTGAHLYFETRVNGTPVNPLLYFDLG